MRPLNHNWNTNTHGFEIVPLAFEWVSMGVFPTMANFGPGGLLENKPIMLSLVYLICPKVDIHTSQENYVIFGIFNENPQHHSSISTTSQMMSCVFLRIFCTAYILCNTHNEKLLSHFLQNWNWHNKNILFQRDIYVDFYISRFIFHLSHALQWHCSLLTQTKKKTMIIIFVLKFFRMVKMQPQMCKST